MVARQAKRRGAADVHVNNVFVLSTHSAVKIHGTGSVLSSVEVTAEGAAKGAEGAPRTDALPRTNPVVWIASVRPVSVSRIRFVATTPGTKSV